LPTVPTFKPAFCSAYEHQSQCHQWNLQGLGFIGDFRKRPSTSEQEKHSMFMNLPRDLAFFLSRQFILVFFNDILGKYRGLHFDA